MPAFFSRVFSRGKDKEKEKGKDGLKEPSEPTSKQGKRTSRASAHSLLEGKFEAVSPSVSPTVERYEEKEQLPKKDKEKERIGLFRPKSRTTSGNDASKKQEEVPRLTLDLNLASTKNDSQKRDLSIVYEGGPILDDAVIGEKRLSPAEALKLMRACIAVLTSRGLETLGVMHPHWHSASPATQRRIISLFLSSLAPSDTTTPASPSSSFDSELEYVRSPHDVAAVFRWALRHVKLEGDTFDKDNTPSLAWYNTFTEKEKKADYPRTAYSDLLLPVVKPSHAELLGATLNLISRLASHSEANGTSGSKLSMFFGHYLLTGNRVENLEDWVAFYSLWEQAGRALEHIFLSSLRDEEAKIGIPRRLSELVVNYPYAKDATDSHFPRPPRFATRSYDAIYVLVTTESAPSRRPNEEVYSPLQMVENALKSDVSGLSVDAELSTVWEDVRKFSGLLESADGKNAPLEKSLGSVLSDDSIRILSLKSNGVDKSTPTVNTFTPVPEHDALFGTPVANGRPKAANGSKSVSRQTSEATASSPVVTDWNAFSSAGFGESGPGQSLAATLLDSDLEKTDPPPPPPRHLRKSRSPTRAARPEAVELPPSPTGVPIRFKTAAVSLTKIDESFIDFWSDALLDPVSNTWPTFIVCQLKQDAERVLNGKKVAWLVIEQKFVPPPPTEPPSPARRAGSPRPSLRSEGENRPGIVSRVTATFSSRKRFNLFGSQSPPQSAVPSVEKRESKSLAKGTKVNELGEIIPEEKEVSVTPKAEEPKASEAKAATEGEKPKDEVPQVPEKDADKSDAVVAGAAAVAVGAGALAVAADALSPEGKEPEAPVQKDAIEELAKDELVKAPVLEAESKPEITPSLEKTAVEEPAPPEPEPTQVEPVQVAEPPAPAQTEVVHDESVQAAQPEVHGSGAPTADVAPPTSAPTEEVAPPQEIAKPIKVEEPTTSIATEETVSIPNHAAGESRFVEHLEVTPIDDKPTELEPIAEHAVPEQPVSAVHGVPETIVEEDAEHDADETVAPVEKEVPEVSDSATPEAGVKPPTEEPSVPAPAAEQPEVSDVKDVSVPAVEVVEEHEPQVAEESKEAVAPAVEKPTTESAEAAPIPVNEKVSTPIIEEDAGPVPEDPVGPVSTEPAPSAHAEEPAVPVVEEHNDAPAETGNAEDHVDEHIPEPAKEHEAPALLKEPAPITADTKTSTPIIEEDAAPVPEPKEPVVPAATEPLLSAEVEESAAPVVEESDDTAPVVENAENHVDEHVHESVKEYEAPATEEPLAAPSEEAAHEEASVPVHPASDSSPLVETEEVDKPTVSVSENSEAKLPESVQPEIKQPIEAKSDVPHSNIPTASKSSEEKVEESNGKLVEKSPEVASS
ncbi:uncharacterized protein FOMMEDRAFT_27267 [Fomitiporia mediterranea MF3/22]|uniref:uncharacterized protein n=1 Tax=Fomitiporia mediterranea (strain MF3/22) TaxID=694068 RepID=UPI000440781E|nr:uncharacterized protein FOMMEDRAFT_27267 [Fomitiporia mediterranea MF3/22]EJD05003.1 hypothetical protein FOMMEDRAFT_27267 [Fomitiporia mediterranea MF3/22]